MFSEGLSRSQILLGGNRRWMTITQRHALCAHPSHKAIPRPFPCAVKSDNPGKGTSQEFARLGQPEHENKVQFACPRFLKPLAPPLAPGIAFGEIGKKIGEQWSKLSDKEKVWLSFPSCWWRHGIAMPAMWFCRCELLSVVWSCAALQAPYEKKAVDDKARYEKEKAAYDKKK